jgi:hypothetical protein
MIATASYEHSRFPSKSFAADRAGSKHGDG